MSRVTFRDVRAPWAGILRDGSRVVFRPVTLLDLWCADAYSSDGDIALAGRPVAVDSDLLAPVATVGDFGPFALSGPADPTADETLPEAGLSGDYTPAAEV